MRFLSCPGRDRLTYPLLVLHCLGLKGSNQLFCANGALFFWAGPHLMLWTHLPLIWPPLETVKSVLIKRGGLISGVDLYCTVDSL